MPDWSSVWAVGGLPAVGLILVAALAAAVATRACLLLALQRASASGSLTLLAVLGTVAPLLGLLGTVMALVRYFSEAQAELGPAVAQALVTTQVGLVLSLPILVVRQLLVRWRERQQGAVA